MKSRFTHVLPAATFVLAAALAPDAARAATPTLKEAIARVEHETGGKVLSAETRRAGKQTIYRIKVITRDGKVKIVEVVAED